MNYVKSEKILIFSPFGIPDVGLALKTIEVGAFPVLSLGRDEAKWKKILDELSQMTDRPFGVCLPFGVNSPPKGFKLPAGVTRVVVSADCRLEVGRGVELIRQVHSAEEALALIAQGATSIIIKGNEGAGRVARESSFILFQKVARECKKHRVKLYVQGGVGVHSSAAFLALGAHGIVLDSQVALMPECSASAEVKSACRKLSGSETIVIDGFRILKRSNSPRLPENPTVEDILPLLGGYDLSQNYLPCGQDITLAADYRERYKNLDNLVEAIRRAAYGHLRQARASAAISENNLFAEELGIRYPVTQGPMARISDVPEFIEDVADGGAMPFLALSVSSGEGCRKMLADTASKMGDRPWGVGILGFVQPSLLEEQTRYILEAKPRAVLIAGGRPSLAAPFEKAGIKVLLHVPSASLLDMFLKEGARNFIFEGRESGGHVGPTASLVLWEKQTGRLLEEENLSTVSVLFAGGIHDALSSAFVSIMAATLAARGAKVGVQMGTSYLYTKEAVASGAITPEYQRLLIENNETILLEAASGQESRAVETPYTEFFIGEKQRLLSEMDAREAWMKLEELNLGRLRIAAKGVGRQDGKLVELSTKEQFEGGLYMTGEVTGLIEKTFTIGALHKRVIDDAVKLIRSLPEIAPPAPATDGMEIAIVGMECVFPGARNREELWRNLFVGKDTVTEVPDTRWNKSVFYKPEGRDTDYSTSKWGAFIPAVDFDPLEFGITPSSLASVEPVQLLSLLVAKRALEDAGYGDLSAVDLENTSVFFGAEGATDLAYTYMLRSGLMQLFGALPPEIDEALPRLTEDSFPGVLSNVIAGRIANRLNLGGRNYTVDAACASSLAAMDVACQELASGRSDMVIAGGADLHNGINDFLMFSSTYALSKKGKSASFSDEADGIVLGEGIGVVVLKRLKDARRDGNKIYAVIRAIEGSSDGRSLGLTAPNRKGQINALERAYRRAGVLPSEVGFVEAHGTGTVVGDRTELAALTSLMLDAGALGGQTRLGSVKTQIGHTKCAAGIAGLIKAALVVQRGVVPPISHMERPNGYYDERNSPFVFNTAPALWGGERRVAGVSAFGFGGTNFHLVLENDRTDRSAESVPLGAWPSELFVFRGATQDDARGRMQKVAEMIAANDALRPKDIAFSLASWGGAEPVQVSIVAGSVGELAQRIAAALEGKRDLNVFPRDEKDGKVAFLFSGQGSQRVNMALDLFAAIPSMRRLLDANPEYEKIVFPDTAFDAATLEKQRETITDTRNAQPLLGMVDFAIADYLRSLGIGADMAAGHSYGEVAALCFAGAFAPENLVSLSRARAGAILDSVGEERGKMAAVSHSSPEELEAFMEGETEVWAVNYNSPRQTVLAGTSAGIEAIVKKGAEKGIACKEINVACAFHSPLLAASQGLYAQVLKGVAFKKPSACVWSNTTAEPYPTKAAEIRGRLAEHLVKPVLFSQQLQNMYADGARIFIETGPGRVLTGLAEHTLGDDVVAIPTESKGAEGITFLVKALGRYLATGKTFDIEKLFEGRGAVALDMENTAQYKKSPTTWLVDGQHAIPSDSRMRQGEMYPINKIYEANMGKEMFSGHANPDRVMMEYLDSLKKMIENQREMIQNQRDVMLGYFGGYVPEPRAVATPYRHTAMIEEGEAVTTEEQETPAAAAESGTGTLAISSLGADELRAIVLEVVSDKTGYPTDMLDLDMDLEADLSIDSIKRMEIIGGLRERLTFPERLAEIEGVVEKMAAIRTLRSMIAWIEEIGAASDASGSVQEAAEAGGDPAQAATQVSAPVEDGELARLALELREAPVLPDESRSVAGRRFAVTGDGSENPFAVAVREALEKQGAEVEIIARGADIPASCDGVIFLNAASGAEGCSVEEMFRLLKGADMGRLKSVLSLSDLTSKALKAKKLKNLADIPGIAGFLKSLAHEYPDTEFRIVDSHVPFTAETLPEIVLDELSVAEKFPEVIYRNGGRFRFDVTAREVDADGEGTLGLDADSVVLVLGGAQGITPELTARLAADYPCNYVLVGRSSLPAEPEKYAALETRDAIRKHLIAAEGMKVPADIEKRVQEIFKSNQIIRALEKITAAGGKAVYRSVDATNPKALKALIADVKTGYGHIDGVIHAAGILDDKLFADKNWKSFERVYSTKVSPLETVVGALLGELKLLVMFSSVSSAFGNRGQCDYAAGNSVFDQLSIVLGEKQLPTRVLSFNWGPWKGAGMVSGLLEEEFRKRGVGLIPLNEGAEFFVRELKYGSEPAVIVMGGEAATIEGFLKGQA